MAALQLAIVKITVAGKNVILMSHQKTVYQTPMGCGNGLLRKDIGGLIMKVLNRNELFNYNFKLTVKFY